ncbi:MAG: exopolysaccharide biosynthesis protein [Alphaproteobacteria bacterium]
MSEFRDTQESLSATLLSVIDSIHGETITLRQLFALIGEQGLLLLCALLTIPFLVPVSIPGVSTVFGAAIILISLGIFLNRLPWLPRKIMDRPLATEKLVPTLRKGAALVGRIDAVVKPRWRGLTDGRLMGRVNGLGIMFGGLLLIMPFGLIPFSNTLPAFAILFLALGILQRDGLFVALGYLATLGTLVYFSALFYAAFAAGQGLSSMFGGG